MSTKYKNSVYEVAGSDNESQPPHAVIQQRAKISRILLFAIFSLIAINMAISITALVFVLSPTNQETSLPSQCRCDVNAAAHELMLAQKNVRRHDKSARGPFSSIAAEKH